MTGELGYGQPMGGIAQTAFVVEDLPSAIDHWVTNCNAGPFFVLDHFKMPGQIYRGEQSTADITLAMGFAGHMQIELIQPNDDHPSVYRETREKRGWGFHHFGKASTDIAGDVAALEARGYVQAFRAGVPTGGEVVYMDGGDGLPGMVEFIEATAGMDAAFTKFWQASVGWDGKDPVRPFG